MPTARTVKTSTPGIYKRGGRYVFSYREGGRQRWKSAGTMAEARTLRDRTRADVSRGKHREVSDKSFPDYSASWLRSYQGRTNRGFRESTRKSYAKHLERAVAYFDGQRGLKPADLTPKDVRLFVTWLVAQHPTMSRATVERHVATLKAMFNTGVQDGDFDRNPAAAARVAVGRKLAEPEERLPLSRDEVRQLLAAAPDQWRTQIWFMVHTGMRIGEFVELRWRDIEFAKRSVVKVKRQFANGVVTEPKSAGGVRTIPLPPSLAAALWPTQGASEDLVFPNSVGNRLDKTAFVRRTLRPIAAEAGIDWAIGSHTLRHTCASLLFADGKNVRQVQRWLGHASPDFTLRTYVHLLEDGVGDSDFLSDLLPEGTELTELAAA